MKTKQRLPNRLRETLFFYDRFHEKTRIDTGEH